MRLACLVFTAWWFSGWLTTISGQSTLPWSRFENISVKDGLSENSASTVYRDALGRVWIGTQNGLNLYNGSQVKVYQSESGLTDNFVCAIQPADSGNLWLGNRHGGNYFNPITEEFIPLYLEDGDERKQHKSVLEIIPLRGKRCLMLGPRVATLVTIHDNKVFTEQLNLFPNRKYNEALAGVGGSLEEGFRIATSHALFKLQIPQLKLEFVDSFANTKRVYFKKGKTWVLTLNYIIKLEDGKEAYRHAISSETSSDVKFLHLREDRKGRLWLSSNDGLLLFKEAQGRLENIFHFKHSIMNVNGISSSSILRTYEDDIGNTWVCHANNGVDLIPENDGFIDVYNGGSLGSSFTSHNVWSFLPLKGQLLVGTEENVLLLDSTQNGYVFNRTILNDVMAVTLCSANNHCVVGTNKNDYYILDKDFQLVQHHQPKDFPNSVIFCAVEFDDELWLGTSRGILRHNWVTNTYQRFFPSQKLDIEIDAPLNVFDLEVLNGTLYGATNKGLFTRYNEKYTIYNHNLNDETSLPYDLVSSVCKVGKEQVWVTTFNGGVAKFNENTSSFWRLGKEDGLLSGSIFGGVVDSEKNIWFSSTPGISIFHPNDSSISGLGDMHRSGISFFQNAFALSLSGRLLFGGNNGFVSINPRKIGSYHQHIYPLNLENLSIDFEKPDKTQGHFELSESGEISALKLNPGQKHFSFALGQASEIDGTRFSYTCQLVGHETLPREITRNGERQVYRNLEGGEYQLQLNCTNLFTRKSLQKVVLVSVVPHWYETVYFKVTLYILLALLLFSLGILENRRRLRKRLRKLELEKTIQQERARISRELHDNIGNRMAYIISSLDFLKNGGQESERKDLANYSRLTLHELRNTVWVLSTKKIEFPVFLNKLRQLVKQTVPPHIQFELNVSAIEESVILKAKVALNTMRMAQEILGNSVKHANATQIEMNISLQEKSLKLEFNDNGVGFEMEAVTLGSGFSNLRKRADEISAVCQIHSQTSKGTQVTLEIPLL